MKKRMILIALIMLFALIKGNSQKEWAHGGAKWTYTQTFFFSPRIDTLTIRAIGDTLIQGHNCKILKRSFANCDGRPLKEYMYSDNGKVYFYDHSRASFQMLYNFNAAVADSFVIYPAEFPANDSIVTIVDSVSTITINSIDLKKLYVHHSSSAIFWTPASSRVIIENIGDTYSMFPWIYGACDASWGGPLRCYDDTIIGFHNFETALSCDYTTTGINENDYSRNLSISPNPAGKLTTIRLPLLQCNANLIIRDIFGNNLMEEKIQQSTQTIVIDVSNITSGIYMLVLRSNNSNYFTKLFINH